LIDLLSPEIIVICGSISGAWTSGFSSVLTSPFPFFSQSTDQTPQIVWEGRLFSPPTSSTLLLPHDFCAVSLKLLFLSATLVFFFRLTVIVFFAFSESAGFRVNQKGQLFLMTLDLPHAGPAPGVFDAFVPL